MEEKAISTGNLSRAITKLLEMISGRAARSHTHEGVYAPATHTHEGVYAKAGEAITGEPGAAGSAGAIVTPTKKALFYIVTIAGRIPGEAPVYTSVMVDRNACATEDSAQFHYCTEYCGNGFLTVAKDGAGIMTFSVSPMDSEEEHYIVRVDGYM